MDGEFDSDDRLTTDFGGSASSVAVQGDGRIVAAGDSGSDFALARYNPDGSPNASFNHDGKVKTELFGGSTDYAYGVAVQEDGKVVAAGYTSSSTSWDFAVARYFGGNDATPPVVKPPAQSLVTNSTLGTSTIPVNLSWSATDSEGTVTRYELQRSADGGAYQNVNLPGATKASTVQSLSPAHNYRFRVRAADDNGNKSFWTYGPRFTVDAFVVLR